LKAIVWTAYGSPDVLQLRDVEKPTPKDNEVLIKVRAATVTMGDCELRSLKVPLLLQLPVRAYMGLTKPSRVTILGQELAGDVEEVGSKVTRFKKGDAVFVPTFLRLGAYAEYKCMPEKYPVLKPPIMSYKEAATIPTGGSNGLYFLRMANVQAGERVLLNGAGGSIGTYAVQIAKSLGAEVTAVDSAEKLAMLRLIGADYVIDYARQDFTRLGETYDVIVDIIGKSSFNDSVRVLKPGGRYILGNPSLSGRMRSRWTRLDSNKKSIVALADYKMEDYAFLKQWIEAGKIKPVIDKVYPLEQTAAAHRYVDEGHKKGNVVITLEKSS
jgi:NADPH:quinone reductase-like Zn-dependent oxidoreductase